MSTDRTGTPGERLYALRFDTGASWLDLVATVGNAYGPAPVERMDNKDRLIDWLAHEQLQPERRPTAADLPYAWRLREVLRPLGLAAARGESLPASGFQALNEFLEEDRPLRIGRDRHGREVIRRPPTVGAALGRVARQAAEHLTGPVADRLRTCDDTECAILFLDPSGRRRWCAADLCGVRHRVREHRRRQQS
jgi:predicted RNA-binding Zn ribbon-like protein